MIHSRHSCALSCVGVLPRSEAHLATHLISHPLIKPDLDLVIVVGAANHHPADLTSQPRQPHVVGHVPSDFGEADRVGVAVDLDEGAEAVPPDDSPGYVSAGGESGNGLGPRLTDMGFAGGV
ncbi:hypothetical protein ACWEN3_24340 [Streptomyces sp. NPDC004561]